MITRLSLSAFRNYHDQTWHIPEGPVVLYGPNGAGKTNVLEAISIFGGSTGLRKAKWAHIPNAHMPTQTTSVYMERQDGISTAITVEPDLSKHYFLNATPSSRTSWAEVWSLMWLTPEHDRLFVASSEMRRHVLDRWVYAFYPEHAANVRQYEKLVRERQIILQQNPHNDMWLTSVEQGLAARAHAIHTHRNLVVEKLLYEQQSIHPVFPRVESSVSISNAGHYEWQKAYAATRVEDKEKGTTQCGPHRSDWLVSRNNLPAALHSTGEQKMMVLTLFLSALSARAALPVSDIRPTLIALLDDIVSHLDKRHRTALMEHIQAIPAQTWMSGTDKPAFEGLRSSHFISCGVEL